MPPSTTKPQATAPAKKVKIILKVNTTAPDPITEFTLFRKMPPELQLLVWKNAQFPRMVTLKPGKSQFPALLHTCTDSRQECIKAGYQFWIRDMNTGFVFSPWQDVLFLDKTSFSDSASYHINAFHTMRCCSIKPTMLAAVEKLAFSINETAAIWKQQCLHCFFRSKLMEVFPNLKELYIILRPGPSGSTFEDLYEVTDGGHGVLRDHIRDISTQFENTQKDGKCKNIIIKFMRNERWIN